MMRMLSVVLLAAFAAPALAQTCKITRKADGLTMLGEVTVAGTVARDMILDTGPFQADIRIDPKAKGYSVKKGEKASLYLFRTGQSVEGKDWREPGSIATEEGGFAFEWPHILLNGKPIPKIDIAFGVGSVSEKWTMNQDTGRKREGTAFVDLTALGKIPDHGFKTLFYGYDEDDAFDIWWDWRAELMKREPIRVKITVPKTDVVIAELSFPQPSQEVMQARLVADVTALRTAVAENRCEAR